MRRYAIWLVLTGQRKYPQLGLGYRCGSLLVSVVLLSLFVDTIWMWLFLGMMIASAYSILRQFTGDHF